MAANSQEFQHMLLLEDLSFICGGPGFDVQPFLTTNILLLILVCMAPVGTSDNLLANLLDSEMLD